MVDSIKLLDITEQNAEEIAEHWAKEVHKNKRTTHYRNIKKEKLVVYAVDFYRNLRKLLVPEDRLEYTREYFQKYAKKCHEIGLPLQEAITDLFSCGVTCGCTPIFRPSSSMPWNTIRRSTVLCESCS